MSGQKSLCGPHVELVKTEGVRITRCPCGTLHLTLSKNGATIQLSPEYFAEDVQALGLARTVLAGLQPSAEHPTTVLDPGRFVTLSPFDPKKPSN